MAHLLVIVDRDHRAAREAAVPWSPPIGLEEA
jgi:hypothetical protein